jgi:hypothetical protein
MLQGQPIQVKGGGLGRPGYAAQPYGLDGIWTEFAYRISRALPGHIGCVVMCNKNTAVCKVDGAPDHIPGSDLGDAIWFSGDGARG